MYWGNWNVSEAGEAVSAFQRGKNERPLKITFHTASFSSPSSESAEAIETLRELAHLPEIEALDTEINSIPYIKISDFESSDSRIPVYVKNPVTSDNLVHTWISLPRQWLDVATHLMEHVDSQQTDAESMVADLLITEVHRKLQQDVFITLSEQILVHRDKPFLRDANLRTPSEAAKNCWTIFAFER